MPDTTGKLRTQRFQGKVSVVFGFTQCPDVCPTALAELAQTMHLLGDEADNASVLIVDPERDTPDVLTAYVNAFHPSFTG